MDCVWSTLYTEATQRRQPTQLVGDLQWKCPNSHTATFVSISRTKEYEFKK